MSFDVGADAYGAFMGRYSEPLAAEYATLLGLHSGVRALDVGCGPGALTAVLAERLGTRAVCAVDPSTPFVAAVRARLPGLDVRTASVGQLPFPDDDFDVVVAQLVVHFMPDPVGGIAEMARVARPGGIVSACVWDHAGGRDPLSVFWPAARDLDPAAHDESDLPGTREGHLVDLFDQAGLADVRGTAMTVTASFANADEWWHPFTLGVGPAGGYVTSLDAGRRRDLRARCVELLPDGAFEITATAWTALGRA